MNISYLDINISPIPFATFEADTFGANTAQHSIFAAPL